ncbi:MAG TPA: hypothetical protein P5287_07320 [bacterium]|nr:hypothetical protein [bacterium]
MRKIILDKRAVEGAARELSTREKRINRGSVIIASALFVLVMSFVVGNYLVIVSSGSIGVKKLNDSTKALYLAEAGVQRMIYQTNSGGSTSVTGSLGSGSYTASYTAGGINTDGNIRSTGTVSGISRTVTVDILDIPPGVRGVVTSNSNLSVGGLMTVDGRDHWFFGVPMSRRPGMYGVSTNASSDFFQSGLAEVGGNGISPDNPANPATYQDRDNNPPPSTPAYASTPWDALGVSQSWYEANVPASSEPPSWFIGVKRYDPPGGTWENANLGISSGILIVHNSTNTAKMKNVTGVFVGLIIADDISNVSAALITGSVITTNTAGTNLGSGLSLGYVGYSNQSLRIAGWMFGGRNGWRKTVKPQSWRET